MRKPGDQEDGVAVVRLFVQQVEREPLLLVARVVLVLDETGHRGQFLRQRRDALNDLPIVVLSSFSSSRILRRSST
jgi:hypothetical protein